MAHPGTLHRYTDKLVAFEHGTTSSSSVPKNLIFWIGGLSDGLLTVHYPAAIGKALPSGWSLVEVLLSSAYEGWGTSSLKRDAGELGDCVKYFRNLPSKKGGKIVLMGHSTGCQDLMEYVVGAEHSSRPAVDGVILQGGVSDREAWAEMVSDGVLKSLIQDAKKLIDEGKENELMNVEGNIVAKEFGSPITAYRTYSLLAKGGDDDYFSTDLEDAVLKGTFGRIPKSTPVMFLLGGEDPYVSRRVSKSGLLKRWTDIIRQGGGVVDDVNGGVVEGAHHNLVGDPDEVVQDLVKRVVNFLARIENGFFEES